MKGRLCSNSDEEMVDGETVQARRDTNDRLVCLPRLTRAKKPQRVVLLPSMIRVIGWVRLAYFCASLPNLSRDAAE